MTRAGSRSPPARPGRAAPAAAPAATGRCRTRRSAPARRAAGCRRPAGRRRADGRRPAADRPRWPAAGRVAAPPPRRRTRHRCGSQPGPRSTRTSAGEFTTTSVVRRVGEQFGQRPGPDELALQQPDQPEHLGVADQHGRFGPQRRRQRGRRRLQPLSTSRRCTRSMTSSVSADRAAGHRSRRRRSQRAAVSTRSRRPSASGPPRGPRRPSASPTSSSRASAGPARIRASSGTPSTSATSPAPSPHGDGPRTTTPASPPNAPIRAHDPFGRPAGAHVGRERPAPPGPPLQHPVRDAGPGCRGRSTTVTSPARRPARARHPRRPASSSAATPRPGTAPSTRPAPTRPGQRPAQRIDRQPPGRRGQIRPPQTALLDAEHHVQRRRPMGRSPPAAPRRPDPPAAAAKATAAGEHGGAGTAAAPSTARQRPSPGPGDGVREHLDQHAVDSASGTVRSTPSRTQSSQSSVRGAAPATTTTPGRRGSPGVDRRDGPARRRSTPPAPRATSAARFRLPAVHRSPPRRRGDPQQIVERPVVVGDDQRSSSIDRLPRSARLRPAPRHSTGTSPNPAGEPTNRMWTKCRAWEQCGRVECAQCRRRCHTCGRQSKPSSRDTGSACMRGTIHGSTDADRIAFAPARRWRAAAADGPGYRGGPRQGGGRGPRGSAPGG